MATPTERLTAIQAHLQNNGHVMVCSYTRPMIYTSKHLAMFSVSANGKDLLVQRGKRHDSLNFSTIKFSVLA